MWFYTGCNQFGCRLEYLLRELMDEVSSQSRWFCVDSDVQNRYYRQTDPVV